MYNVKIIKTYPLNLLKSNFGTKSKYSENSLKNSKLLLMKMKMLMKMLINVKMSIERVMFQFFFFKIQM